MDASDTIRRMKASKVYADISASRKTVQGNANCGTCSELSCKRVFASFEEKQLYLEGKEKCRGCKCDR
jgi:hypothetical protein